MIFFGLRKLGNICCGHKIVSEQNLKHFLSPGHIFVSRTQNLCPQQILRALETAAHIKEKLKVMISIVHFTKMFRLVTERFFSFFSIRRKPFERIIHQKENRDHRALNRGEAIAMVISICPVIVHFVEANISFQKVFSNVTQ